MACGCSPRAPAPTRPGRGRSKRARLSSRCPCRTRPRTGRYRPGPCLCTDEPRTPGVHLLSLHEPGEPVTPRTDLRPGDLGTIVRMHGVIYARERGFDPTFEAYVAGPLAEFVRSPSPRQRLWVA